MKYGILSDIHGNIEALNAALAKLDDLGVERLVNLGDAVGYYTAPNECVDRLRERDAVSIMGNHDVVACGRVEPVFFNPTAAQAILWARENLRDDNREYINGLPDSRKIADDVLAVHGSVRDRDEYLLFRPEIERSFDALETTYPGVRVVFFGHTHRRIYYEKESDKLYAGTSGDPLTLRGDSLYLINPGSVGQPRDGDPRAAFCVFDDEARVVDFHRVGFDTDKVAEAVRALPFGASLAERLYRGV
ncbi:MAG: metallophosphatase family protein [Deltaproteobacteria bacterium]|nr:metallophosphatase family protein [Deltaproteobacteria bacterium]